MLGPMPIVDPSFGGSQPHYLLDVMGLSDTRKCLPVLLPYAIFELGGDSVSCYHPLKGFQVGLTENGKPEYKVCTYDVQYVEIYVNRSNLERKVVPVTSLMVKNGYKSQSFPNYRLIQQNTYFVELPCGKCIGCRLDYSRRWADRMMLELQYHKDAYFVTLTYDNDHVPYTYYEDTGELAALSLRKKDFQDFMKRLRKNTGQKLRYFACGEYGTHTFRPHYHMILYGLHLDDSLLQFYKKDPSGKFSYFKCQYLADIWKQGYVVVSKVTWETCAYTARYVTKKLCGPEADFYAIYGIEPPSSMMSRKPGIGRQYYEDHPELFEYENINISTETGGKSLRIPRYFDSLLEVDDSELAQVRKEKRQSLAIEYKKMLQAQTDLPWEEYLLTLESKKLGSAKQLERSLD